MYFICKFCIFYVKMKIIVFFLHKIYIFALIYLKVRDDVEPRENFMRGWEDYKVGFGDFDREFWLGNILIWALTNVDNATK
jgi:hypothetical protein